MNNNFKKIKQDLFSEFDKQYNPIHGKYLLAKKKYQKKVKKACNTENIIELMNIKFNNEFWIKVNQQVMNNLTK